MNNIIRKAIEKRNRKTYLKNCQEIIGFVIDWLNKEISYVLENTELTTLATIEISSVCNRLRLDGLKICIDRDITYITETIIPMLDENIKNYCKENNFICNTEGDFNTATSWRNGKKYYIELEE